jgi:hypothetical protein
MAASAQPPAVANTAEVQEETTSIRGEQIRQVGRFVIRVGLFWLPVIALVVCFETYLWHTGESLPVREVVARQQHRDDLFLRGYFDQAIYPYKLAGLKARRPEIIALGSSRTIQFRREMFGNQANGFYNCGSALQGLDDLESFLAALQPEEMPKVILLGVDAWWFNTKWKKQTTIHDPVWDWMVHASTLQRFLLKPQLMRPELNVKPADAEHRIGLMARFSGAGFRQDGSMQLALPVPGDAREWRYVDHEDPKVLDRIEHGLVNFAYPDEFSRKDLARLRSILKTLQARGALVIGFAPPLASDARAAISAHPRHRPFWDTYSEEVPRIFAEYDFPYFDGSNLEKIGLDDRYLVDGYHAAETYHLHLLLAMLRDDRVKSALPNAEPAIRASLASPRTNFWYSHYPADQQSYAKEAYRQ